jgi:ABC-2 type transport system permease protein
MIATLLRIFWLHLRRDRVVWVLTFIVPVAFFSVFAIIFSGTGKRQTSAIRLVVVDEDHSEFSKKLVTTLIDEKSLRVVTQADADPARPGAEPPALTRAEAEAQVRDGKVSAAIIMPEGLGKAFPDFSGNRPTIELLADTSDPVAPQMLSGMLQGLVLTSAPDTMMKGGIDQLKLWGGPLTPQQEQAIDQAMKFLKKPDKASGSGSGKDGFNGLVNVQVVDVLGQQKANPVVAFYAAATAVMFLLFSCANGAGGTLIEEVDSGTLDRLLSSNLTMTQLLAGKWISFTLLGVMQISVMFLWGWLAFRLELWSHIPGFLVMTIVTSAAAAAFGLVLGTLCRTRGQLSGLSTTVILLMSAVGGSMFPRFMMSDTLKNIGLGTFNAWALDGYQKVFWRDAPVWQLWPQLLVLLGLTAVFLGVSRWLARRWEVV